MTKLLGIPFILFLFDIRLVLGSSSLTISCPSDFDIYNKNKYTLDKFRVKRPTLKSTLLEIPTVHCSPSEISLKDYGEHKIVCTAETINGSSHNCSYKVRVKDHLCSILSPPVNGQVKCTTHCFVTCDEDFVLAKSVTEKMACYGERWRPEEDRNINLLPVCLPKLSPTRIKMRSRIEFKQACGMLDQHKAVLMFQFRKQVDIILEKTQEIKETLTVVETKNVSITCSEQKYWLVEGHLNVIVMRFTLILSSPQSKVDPVINRKVLTIKNILFKKVNDGTFTFTVNKNLVQAMENSFQGDESSVCGPLEVKRSSSCIKCSFGLYFNKTTRNCEPCPMGFYQNKEGQTNCEQCPVETSTVVMGTVTRLGCYGDNLLSNIVIRTNTLDVIKFKNVIVFIVNHHCQTNGCLHEIKENNGSVGSFTESLSIFPNDVVIARGYPKQSKQNYQLLVAFFVVVSIQNNRPRFFPREKLRSIMLENEAIFEEKLGRKNEDQHNKGSSFSYTFIYVAVALFTLVIIVVTLICVIRRKLHEPRRTKELQIDNQTYQEDIGIRQRETDEERIYHEVLYQTEPTQYGEEDRAQHETDEESLYLEVVHQSEPTQYGEENREQHKTDEEIIYHEVLYQTEATQDCAAPNEGIYVNNYDSLDGSHRETIPERMYQRLLPNTPDQIIADHHLDDVDGGQLANSD